MLVPVPEGVEALQLTLDGIADGSQVRILPIDPDGMPADSNASNHCYTDYADPAELRRHGARGVPAEAGRLGVRHRGASHLGHRRQHVHRGGLAAGHERGSRDRPRSTR